MTLKASRLTRADKKTTMVHMHLSKFASTTLVLLVLAACAPSVTNFEECIAAGNPVMESYPRQCRGGGKTFVEDVGDDAQNDLINVDDPSPNELVKSPLVVTGEARGVWYFEASFPVHLFDEDNNEIAIAPAQAQGDWMTEEFVPFSVTLSFAEPTTDRGYLILEKDNPSGLPENADGIRVPVRFR